MYIFVFVSVVAIMSGCTSSRSSSFAAMDKNNAFAQTVVKTDEVCEFELDATTFDDVDITVYESERGSIVLSKIEELASNRIELKFRAYGAPDSESATIMTACTYKEDAFLQSPIIVEPSDGIITKYSYMTTEFEEFGNCFSIIVFFENNTVDEIGVITVTLQDLYLVEFDLL